MDIGIIRDYLVVITTGITILGIFIKNLNNFFLDLIKSKYEPIPAKQKLFDTIIKTVTYIILIIELIFLALIITSIFDKYLESEPVKKNLGMLSCIAWILILLIVTTFGLTMYLSNKLAYIFRDNHGEKTKSKKKYVELLLNLKIFKDNKKVLNMFNKVMAIFMAAICVIFIISYILNKNFQSAGVMGLFFIIAISMFIISNSLTPAIDVVNHKYNYYMVMKSGDVLITNFFLEFEDNYLIFKNGIQRYISKQEVKEIQKRFIKNIN